MFASIPNYKEFYIENDLNKQARAAQDYMYQIFMFWVGSAGLNMYNRWLCTEWTAQDLPMYYIRELCTGWAAQD